MGEMLGRSNLIGDIDLNALIVEDYSSSTPVECNLPNGVESDSLVVCNASSSFFDGDHDDIPDGCNTSGGGGGTSTDANADDSSIPAIFSNVLLIIPPPVLLLPISAITSPNSTTVSAIFLKTEVTFFKASSDNSAWTFSSILSCTRSSSRSNRGITFPLPNCPDFTSDFILSLTFSSVHDVTAGDILCILFPLNSKRSRLALNTSGEGVVLLQMPMLDDSSVIPAQQNHLILGLFPLQQGLRRGHSRFQKMGVECDGDCEVVRLFWLSCTLRESSSAIFSNVLLINSTSSPACCQSSSHSPQPNSTTWCQPSSSRRRNLLQSLSQTISGLDILIQSSHVHVLLPVQNVGSPFPFPIVPDFTSDCLFSPSTLSSSMNVTAGRYPLYLVPLNSKRSRYVNCV
nr:hypothetical protein Iba_chr09eCG12200 [Ipomoea batatas]